jgi:TRAP-type C4-dicarboxylate transport system permease small subunit
MFVVKWLDQHLEGTIAAFLLAAMVSLISFNVFMRYVLDSSTSWGEELTLWTFVWFVWLAISHAFRHRKHVRITVFRDMLGERGRLGLDMVVDVLILIFLAVLFYECFKLTNLPFVANQKSVVLGLPIPILYSSALVGTALSFFRVIQHIVINFRALSAPQV